MKSTPEMPADLDLQAKRKWKELVLTCDPDVDVELLGNYCRQHSSLMAIRAEKKRLQKTGAFKTMVAGRDGTEIVNPLITTENRLIAGLNRMLKTLGFSASQDGAKVKRKVPSLPRPPGFMGEEPPCGWAMEAALCGYRFNEQTNSWEAFATPELYERERLQ